MKKLLILLFSTLVLSNSAIGASFTCTNWESEVNGEMDGTLMVGEKIGNNFIIKDAYENIRTLNYLGKYNFNIKLYSAEDPKYETVGIFAIAAYSILGDGYDLKITAIQYEGKYNQSTYCNYQ